MVLVHVLLASVGRHAYLFETWSVVPKFEVKDFVSLVSSRYFPLGKCFPRRNTTSKVQHCLIKLWAMAHLENYKLTLFYFDHFIIDHLFRLNETED